MIEAGNLVTLVGEGQAIGYKEVKVETTAVLAQALCTISLTIGS